MTNEEKVKELAFEEVGGFIDSFIGKKFLSAIMKMAEWKDQQLKEYLEKKRVELFNTNCLSVEPFIDFIDKIINELFNKK